MKTIILVVLFFLFFLSNIRHEKYITFLPTMPFYPNNEKESVLVKNSIHTRSHDDVNFFYLTNESVIHAFKPYVSESETYLMKKSSEHNYIILFFKYFINRARPAQIDSSIEPVDISTAQTPAFPAGHAYQAYYLEKHLSKKYPEKSNLFKSIAKECDLTRVKAGLHYPSDGDFSKQLVDFFSNLHLN
tara:strand:- start:1349 stop:1912 length:564 start_codon:yes stop_codon:yes gene_type:complete